MSPPPPHLDDDLTRLLQEVGSGQRPASDLVAAVYNELRRMAAHQMARERVEHTLEPTALVNEMFIKLNGATPVFQNRAHFFGAAARAMRQILVDSARAKLTERRGGGRVREELSDQDLATPRPPEEILVVNELLELLERTDPRKHQILGLWYFAGLTHEIIAEVLDLDPRTIGREMQFLRSFVSGHLNPDA